jgi:hypothetical protein
MDTGKLGQGALIAAVSGVALFIIMFFAWFGAPGPADEAIEQANEIAEQFGGQAVTEEIDTTANAWQSFDLIDLVLFLAVLVSIGMAVLTASGASASLPVAGSAITAGIGAFAFLLVLYRILDPPAEADREIGVFLGLLATAGIAVGGYLGMQEEGTSLDDVGRGLSGGTRR